MVPGAESDRDGFILGSGRGLLGGSVSGESGSCFGVGLFFFRPLGVGLGSSIPFAVVFARVFLDLRSLVIHRGLWNLV